MAKSHRISVVDRRKKHPFGGGSVADLLKDRSLTVRIVNSGKKADHIYQMQHDKGWVFVVPEDLNGTPEELGFVVENGRVVRGDRGQEVLMKMPKKDYQEIQWAKTRENLKGMGDSKKVKQQLAEAAANQFGAEAGDFVDEHFVGEVIDSKERVTVAE